MENAVSTQAQGVLKPYTKEFLLAVPLPESTDTYTTISHDSIMSAVEKKLAEKGYGILNAVYKHNQSGQIAYGVYQLASGQDPDVGMLFAWANSYDKSRRFRCAMGGFTRVNGMTILGTDDSGTFKRKHTGDSDKEVIETINQQIDNAVNYYDQLIQDKEAMKLIELDERKFAEILGRLYLTERLLTGEQLGIISKQFRKPEYEYDNDKSLWALYNHVLHALVKCHPAKWMLQQRAIHLFFATEYNLMDFDEPTVDSTESSVETESDVLGITHTVGEAMANAAETMKHTQAKAGDYQGDDPGVAIAVDTGVKGEDQTVTETFDPAPTGPEVIINTVSTEENEEVLDTEEEFDMSGEMTLPIEGEVYEEIETLEETTGITSGETEEIVEEIVEEPIAEKVVDQPESKEEIEVPEGMQLVNGKLIPFKANIDNPKVERVDPLTPEEIAARCGIDMSIDYLSIQEIEDRYGKPAVDKLREVMGEQLDKLITKTQKEAVAEPQVEKVVVKGFALPDPNQKKAVIKAPVHPEIDEIDKSDIEAAAEKYDQIVENDEGTEETAAALEVAKEKVPSAFKPMDTPAKPLAEAQAPNSETASNPVEETIEMEETLDMEMEMIESDELELEEEMQTIETEAEEIQATEVETAEEPEVDAPVIEEEKEAPIMMDSKEIEIMDPPVTLKQPEEEENPIRQVMSAELLDLYGELQEFTFEAKDDQYNIKTSSGETICLTKKYVDDRAAAIK